MYHIPFQIPPSFNDNPNSELYQQNWKIEPADLLPPVVFIGETNPADVILNIAIPDYRKSFPDMYEDFYVKLEITGLTPFFSVSGDIPLAPGRLKITSDADLDVTNTINYNTSNLLAGSYSAMLHYIVEAELANGDFVEIDRKEKEIAIEVIEESELAVFPKGFVSLSHLSGDPEPSQTRSIYANGIFYIEVPKFINISGFNINPYDETADTYIFTGSGTQEIIISVDVLHPDFEENAIMVFSQNDYYVSEGITTHRYFSPQLAVTPSEMEFISVKELFEATFQFFHIESSGNWTITLPYFMTTGTPLSGTGNFTANIAPMHSDNFAPGIYEGKIKIVSANITREINVCYKVIDLVDFGVRTNDLNFTRDHDTITTVYDTSNLNSGSGFSQELPSLKVDFQVLVRAERNRIFHFSQGIFNRKTEFFLGNIIDKTIQPVDVIENLNLDDSGVSIGHPSGMSHTVRGLYDPANVQLLIQMFNRNTGNQFSNDRIADPVFFLKGRRPKRYYAGLGLIDFHESPVRVTRNSIATYAVYSNIVALVDVLRNGEKIQTIVPDAGSNLFFTLFLGFQNFTPGDVIDVKLRRPAGIADNINRTQRYIMFPEGKESYHIAWENEHGVPFLMEFTGDYSFQGEYKGIVADTFQKFLEIREKTGTQRILKFKANTGWILKSNQERIDSLQHAKRAWIVFKDETKPISLLPADAKLTKIDSTAETYQYTIDFTINPRHEIENSPSEL